MKHIAEEYDMKTNLLTLTREEYAQLEPFLRQLGIRCRVTTWDSKEMIIQAENPYKNELHIAAVSDLEIKRYEQRADELMTDEYISLYKR